MNNLIETIEAWVKGEPGTIREAEFSYNIQQHFTCKLTEWDAVPPAYKFNSVKYGVGETLTEAFNVAMFGIDLNAEAE